MTTALRPTSSTAALQGYLLRHKDQPQAAVDGAASTSFLRRSILYCAVDIGSLRPVMQGGSSSRSRPTRSSAATPRPTGTSGRSCRSRKRYVARLSILRHLRLTHLASPSQRRIQRKKAKMQKEALEGEGIESDSSEPEDGTSPHRSRRHDRASSKEKDSAVGGQQSDA
jgi:hypothetical protein